MPYLRMYDGYSGSKEHGLTKPETMIGRLPGIADIVVSDPAVSRKHAVIKPYEGVHMIEDAGSRTGMLINGHPMQCCQLAHGVTIQVGPCTMEYRTDDEARVLKTKDTTPFTTRLRESFSLLPKGVRMRYRTVAAKPGDLFKSGDTLDFGGGGVLLPGASPLKAGQCMEVEITPQSGKTRSYLGEVLDVLQDRATPEMCIKLHIVPKAKHEEAVKKADAWVDAWPQA